METELLVCLCGRVKESYDPDPVRTEFIRQTYKRFGKEVPRGCKLNETSTDKYKLLAASL